MDSFQSFLSVTTMAEPLPSAARAKTPRRVTSMAEAKAMYERDVEACHCGEVQEDRRICLGEAKRAYEDSKREALRRQRARSARGKAASASQ